MQNSDFAYITLLSGENYLPGAIALARSLKLVESCAQLQVIIPKSSYNFSIDGLEKEGVSIIFVDDLPLSDEFMQRHTRENQHKLSPFTKGEKPHFHNPIYNFYKLYCWQLTQFKKVIFLDADVITIKNIDKLFAYPEFSAAPNVYDSLSGFSRLNSGVFVATPSVNTFENMLKTLDAPQAYWSRTDQTFLEEFWPDWCGLPYTFNALQYVYFNFPELWSWEKIHVIHYQYEKPWEDNHAKEKLLKPLTDLWWAVYQNKHIKDFVC